MSPRGRLPVAIEVRFWPPVDKSGGDAGCWVWTGSRDENGYGMVWYEGRSQRSHRVSWVLANGAIADGLQVLHKCDNPPCVNPSHLFLGTNTDNVADKVAKGRLVSANAKKAHCKRGHAFVGRNVRWAVRAGRPRRSCRACKREFDTRAREARRAEMQNGLRVEVG